MLHCNMNPHTTPQWVLDDLLADLRYARRGGDLGRLALIAYCEVRRWARQVGEFDVSKRSASMLTEEPYASREAFLAQVDSLICELEQAQSRLYGPGSATMARPDAGVPDQPISTPTLATATVQSHRA